MLELGNSIKRGRKSSQDIKTPQKKRNQKILLHQKSNRMVKKVTGQASRCPDIHCSSRTRYICDKC